MFQKSTSHFKILVARSGRKFQTEGP